MKEFDEEAFVADARKTGLSTNALAKIHGLSWADAKAKRAAIPTEQPAAGGEEDAAEEYTININVPADGIEQLLRAVPYAELIEAIFECEQVDQANVLQRVLQRRMCKLFEAPAQALEIPPFELMQGGANG